MSVTPMAGLVRGSEGLWAADLGDGLARIDNNPWYAWNIAAPPWTPPAATRNATACPGPATGASTERCTSWPSSSSATTHPAAPTSAAASPRAKPRWKRCGHSNDDCPTWSTANLSPTRRRRAREDTRRRLRHPARPTQLRRSALRTSHSPGSPTSQPTARLTEGLRRPRPHRDYRGP